MRSHFKNLSESTRNALRQVLSGPQALAFLPAAILAAFWLGGEPLLIVFAIVLPLGLLCFGSYARTRLLNLLGRPRPLASTGSDVLIAELDAKLRQARSNGLKSACILVAIDDHNEITDRFGMAAAQKVTECTLERLQAAVRSRDKVFLLNENCIAIVIAPVRQLDLDVGLHMITRLQSAVEEPVTMDATTIYVSASVGFCISTQLKEKTGQSLTNCATLALNDAQRHAPSAIRSYSPGMRASQSMPSIQNDEVTRALENGQIQAWFQPQVSTDTGKITGFEALARWMHPERGVISPAEFLPLLEDNAQMEHLGTVMLQQSLSALVSWDLQGLDVPHVGVNFSPEELRNPRLLEKIEWELDRFNLTPDRLVVEILETVVATSPDDTIARNINGMSALGCQVDLDDFGTGHASISSIRRFAVQRLKIDRSFVMKVDQDPEQQRMVSAILLMAERLGLDTLAEGVETAGEHTMLAQLGCGHVQGFGLGRPMPFDKTAAWIKSYSTKLKVPPIIGRKTG